MMYALLQALIVPLARRKILRCEGVEHLPEHGAFILIANHVSWLDPVYLTAAAGLRFRGRLLFLAATAKHRWTQAVIPINRKNPGASLAVAERHLNKGHAISIFPRGNQRDGTEKPKTGAARLARASGTPVIPAGIMNATHGHMLRSLWGFFRPGAHIVIRFGAPIRLSMGTTPVQNNLSADAEHLDRAVQDLLLPGRL